MVLSFTGGGLLVGATILFVVLWKLAGKFEDLSIRFGEPSDEPGSAQASRVWSAETRDHREAEFLGEAWHPLDRTFWRLFVYSVRGILLVAYVACVRQLL